MSAGVEIIDFSRPDTNRKNLFITNIPGTLTDADVVFELHNIFDNFGLVYGVQVFPDQLKFSKDADTVKNTDANVNQAGYYAFVTFYSASEATKAKESLNSVVLLGDSECKVSFAKRKKDAVAKQVLYITRCYELINHYLGFNSWSTSIKTMFEDEESRQETDHTVTIKYVCMVELTVRDLKTDGVGVTEETYLKNDPMSRIQVVCKCKKLCHHRALENAFSKVILVVLDSGKVHVEIDTTKPDFTSEVQVPVDQLVKINELDDQPVDDDDADDKTAADKANSLSASLVDDINLHILQELEDDM